tara:strand:- start:278 stop:478 length:201 start_codon:yes stop_codon:yes gene_type:complete
MKVGDLVNVRSTPCSLNWKPEAGELGIITSPKAVADCYQVMSAKNGISLWVRKYRVTLCNRAEDGN